MKNKVTVIYHRADFDGLFCREIARKFLPEAELIGWDYGDARIPMPNEGMVYILDLSPECLEETPGGEMVPFWDRIVWIDHHRSAIERFPTSIHGYRIDGVAACRLAWQWFYLHGAPATIWPDKTGYVERKVREPWAVRLAGEYDIWDKRDPDAELFQHGLRSCELSENLWDLLLSGPTPQMEEKRGIGELAVEALLENGKVLQYAQTKQNESIIKAAGFTFAWEGLTFLACNHARFNSHLFTAGIGPEHDALFGFCWDGSQWKVSLYGVPGKPDIDLAAIAVKYGGGGHKQACGFRSHTLPFLTPNPEGK